MKTIEMEVTELVKPFEEINSIQDLQRSQS